MEYPYQVDMLYNCLHLGHSWVPRFLGLPYWGNASHFPGTTWVPGAFQKWGTPCYRWMVSFHGKIVDGWCGGDGMAPILGRLHFGVYEVGGSETVLSHLNLSISQSFCHHMFGNLSRIYWIHVQ